MLASLGILRVTGPEVESFLTAQFTNDVGALPESRSQLSAWCNAQGRVLVVFRLLRHEGSYVLVLPREMIGSTLKRLKKYVLRAKVTLEEASEELRLLAAFGPQTLAGVAAHLPPIPEQENTVAYRAGVSVIRVPGALPRWLIIGAKESLAALGAKEPAADVSDTAWRFGTSTLECPRWSRRPRGAFLPQMLNLDALGGVSFTKGCYPGQEVIARLQYRGQLKRRMYLALLEDAAVPRAGNRVYSRAYLGSQPAGQIVAAAPRDSRVSRCLPWSTTKPRTPGASICGTPTDPRSLSSRCPTQSLTPVIVLDREREHGASEASMIRVLSRRGGSRDRILRPFGGRCAVGPSS